MSARCCGQLPPRSAAIWQGWDRSCSTTHAQAGGAGWGYQGQTWGQGGLLLVQPVYQPGSAPWPVPSCARAPRKQPKEGTVRQFSEEPASVPHS